MVTSRIAIPLLVLYGTWCAHAAVDCRDAGAGRFADPADGNCKNYTLCIYVRETDSYLSYNAVCPSESVFDPITAKCVSPKKYTCTSRIIAVKTNKTCTFDGFVADPGAKNCSTYIQCVNIYGTFIQLRQNCPSKTYFNPSTTLCETNYRCNNRIAVKNKPKPSKICTYDGFIPDPEVTNCSTYIQCVNIFGTFIQLRQSCPSETYFNPGTTLCETNYRCAKFRCLLPGRIADTSDHTCRKYYYCVQLNNGMFAQYDFSCPDDWMFDPDTTLCTTNYACKPFGQKGQNQMIRKK